MLNMNHKNNKAITCEANNTSNLEYIRLKSFFSILILCCLGLNSSAQGINIHFGTSSATNKFLTPDGFSNSGFVLGADVRLNEGNMYFYGGVQYHKLGFTPTESFSLFPEDPSFNFLKFRVGLGYNLFDINDNMIVFRGKTLASFDIINGVPETSLITFNDGVAGLVLGLGVDVFMITLDVEYEIGFFNAVNQIKETSYSFINFTTGVIF